MKVTGHRKSRPVTANASGDLLKKGALFNDEIHKLPTGFTTAFPKGVYRYASNEEANFHWMECVVKGMVQHARLIPYVEIINLDGISVRTLSLDGLLKTKQSGRDKDKIDRLVLEKALAVLRS